MPLCEAVRATDRWLARLEPLPVYRTHTAALTGVTGGEVTSPQPSMASSVGGSNQTFIVFVLSSMLISSAPVAAGFSLGVTDFRSELEALS